MFSRSHQPNEGKTSRLQRARQIQAMRRAFNVVKNRQRINISRISDIDGRKRRLRQVRERVVGNEVLLNQAIENLRQNGIKIHRAVSKEDAASLVVQEMAGNRLVVKSKSNLTKEIGLTEALEAVGIEVIETDIGDRIIQLCGGMPSHPTGPASHLTRHDIAEVLSAHFGKKVEPTPKALVKLIRDEISAYVERANIGITGANAIAVEEGAILLLHNEGNIIQVAMRPEKHIVLAGIDKLYPNLEEALNMMKLQTFYATGSLATSFVNIISGPSQTADIEKQLFKGVHGPKDICLILVDNHRSDIANSECKELLYCIGCGQCLLVCPAYTVYGSRFSNDGHLGGKGVVYSVLSNEISLEGKKSLDLCLSCRKCQQSCPLDIDTPSLITALRLQRRERVMEPHLRVACDFVTAHVKWLYSAICLESLMLVSRLLQLPHDD